MVVNDAVVAHAGALLSRSGIIAIGGTGSIVFGVNEAGSHLRNYDFRHWAGANASPIAHHAMHRLLAGDGTLADHALRRPGPGLLGGTVPGGAAAARREGLHG